MSPLTKKRFCLCFSDFFFCGSLYISSDVLSLFSFPEIREVYVNDLADELNYPEVMQKACTSVVKATTSRDSPINTQVRNISSAYSFRVVQPLSLRRS